MNVKQRVVAGVEFLNKRRPTWLRKVDEKTLDISDCCNCIFGQLDGDYSDSITINSHSEEWAAEHGFTTPMDESGEETENGSALTREWRRAIRQLRGATSE